MNAAREALKRFRITYPGQRSPKSSANEEYYRLRTTLSSLFGEDQDKWKKDVELVNRGKDYVEARCFSERGLDLFTRACRDGHLKGAISIFEDEDDKQGVLQENPFDIIERLEKERNTAISDYTTAVGDRDRIRDELRTLTTGPNSYESLLERASQVPVLREEKSKLLARVEELAGDQDRAALLEEARIARSHLETHMGTHNTNLNAYAALASRVQGLEADLGVAPRRINELEVENLELRTELKKPNLDDPLDIESQKIETLHQALAAAGSTAREIGIESLFELYQEKEGTIEDAVLEEVDDPRISILGGIDAIKAIAVLDLADVVGYPQEKDLTRAKGEAEYFEKVKVAFDGDGNLTDPELFRSITGGMPTSFASTIYTTASSSYPSALAIVQMEVEVRERWEEAKITVPRITEVEERILQKEAKILEIKRDLEDTIAGNQRIGFELSVVGRELGKYVCRVRLPIRKDQESYDISQQIEMVVLSVILGEGRSIELRQTKEEGYKTHDLLVNTDEVGSPRDLAMLVYGIAEDSTRVPSLSGMNLELTASVSFKAGTLERLASPVVIAEPTPVVIAEPTPGAIIKPTPERIVEESLESIAGSYTNPYESLLAEQEQRATELGIELGNAGDYHIKIPSQESDKRRRFEHMLFGTRAAHIVIAREPGISSEELKNEVITVLVESGFIPEDYDQRKARTDIKDWAKDKLAGTGLVEISKVDRQNTYRLAGVGE
jgi:hypothetical protein